MYKKIVKYLMWALLIISVAVVAWGSLKGLTANGGQPIDVLLYWTYALVALSIAIILVFGIGISASQSKKALLKIVLVLVGLVAVVALAYVLAPGTPAVGLVTDTPVTDGQLKLTDTVLNLTYFSSVAAIIAILFSAIVGAVRK